MRDNSKVDDKATSVEELPDDALECVSGGQDSV